METPAAKITIHMVTSLDGFIAKPDGSVSWMQPRDQYEGGETLTMEKIEAFLQSVDCYVLGSYTDEHALELGWPYGEKPVIVLTSRQLSAKHKTVEFYSGDLNLPFSDSDLQARSPGAHKHLWLCHPRQTRALNQN